MINLRHYICHESINVVVFLGARLVVLHVILTGHLSCVMLTNPTILLTVDLVANEHLGYVFIGVLVYAL